MVRLLLGHNDIDVDIPGPLDIELSSEQKERRKTIARLLVNHKSVGVESKQDANQLLMQQPHKWMHLLEPEIDHPKYPKLEEDVNQCLE